LGGAPESGLSYHGFGPIAKALSLKGWRSAGLGFASSPDPGKDNGRFGETVRVHKRAIGALMIAAAALVACGSADSPAATQNADLKRNKEDYVDITVGQLDAMLAAKECVLVIVPVPREGEIPRTDLFIPFDQIGANLCQFPAKDAPIVLYCRNGNMSTTAAKELARLGDNQCDGARPRVQRLGSGRAQTDTPAVT
jgi:rhodanese-related sulfurtransferase